MNFKRTTQLLAVSIFVLLGSRALPASAQTKPPTTLKGHTKFVISVAFSPDGKRIVSGSDDKTAMVWDVEKGQEILTLKGHTDGINSVAFSPNTV